MFCAKCGKYNPEGTAKCKYCGSGYFTREPNYHTMENKYNAEHRGGGSKSGVGFALGFFFGLIGLIIGLLLYGSGTYERETFISGWVKAFITSIVIGVIIGLFTYCAILEALSGYYYY